MNLIGDPLACLEEMNSEITLTPYILDCNCVTTSEQEERKMIEVGKCDSNCGRYQNHMDLVYQQLPSNMSDWNNFMCGEFKRSGTLCGKCDEDRNY